MKNYITIKCTCGAVALKDAAAIVTFPPSHLGGSRTQHFCDRSCAAYKAARKAADKAWSTFHAQELRSWAAGAVGRVQASLGRLLIQAEAEAVNNAASVGHELIFSS